MIGEVVGSYRVTAKLAEGGMGAVYRAEHQLIGKPAAVKVLLPELSNNRDIVNRFFNEARAATAVRHPGIVEIFDFGYLPSGLAYIVMELLDGEPLSRRLASRGRIGEREALVLTRGIASSLAAAHALGIVHRDLKPDNVFLVPDPDMPGGERPKLLDFGIAKISEAQRAGGAASKTRTGAVLGTPTYMSPEQCKGAGEVDHRADLYSLGCILYEMVAGRPPFQAEGLGEIIGAHLYMQPTPPSQLGAMVSQAGELLIMQLLQKRPEDRVQSAQELARLLGQGSMPGVEQFGAPTVAMAPMHTPVPMRTPAPSPLTAPGAVGQPSTLGSTGGAGGGTLGAAVEAPRRSRAPLIAAVGLCVAAGGVAAIVLGGGGSKPTAAPPAAIAVEPPDAAVVAPPDAAQVAEVIVDAGVIEPPAIDAGAAATASPGGHHPDPPSGHHRTEGTTKPAGSTGSGSGSAKINRGD